MGNRGIPRHIPQNAPRAANPTKVTALESHSGSRPFFVVGQPYHVPRFWVNPKSEVTSEKMYLKNSTALDSTLSSKIKLLLHTIAQEADEDGFCCLTIHDLTRFTSMSERLVRRTLAEVIDLGLVKHDPGPPGLPDAFTITCIQSERWCEDVY